jgi:hypothetical protein
LSANCVRRILSGNHYAQIRVRGKLIWTSAFQMPGHYRGKCSASSSPAFLTP